MTMHQMTESGLLRLECVAIRDETPTIKTFTFRVTNGPLHREAGQSMTLALERNGAVIYRTFSISSAPDGSDLVEMTIKAHADGGVTRWLHQTIGPGAAIEAKPPRGHFTLSRRSEGSSIAFISAGSGATPLMAMLRQFAKDEPDVDVAWVHAARDPHEILFASEVAKLQADMPKLTVSVTVSHFLPGWIGYRGRITRRMMSVMVSDLARREVFCCGPAPFMDEMRLIYTAEGGKGPGFFTESFGNTPMVSFPTSSGIDADVPMSAHTITANGRILETVSGETVLQACLRQGVIIPCGCGQGMCGTCMVKKLSGAVMMQHQGGITEEEERDDFILACSARPSSDLEIAIG
jgi:ferredoxin-NADP reductase